MKILTIIASPWFAVVYVILGLAWMLGMAHRDPSSGKFVKGNASKDVFPQWLALNIVTANGVTYATSSTRVPVKDNEVMEILGVQYNYNVPTFATVGTPAGDQDFQIQLQLTQNVQTFIVGFQDSDLLDKIKVRKETVAMEATETGSAGLGAHEETIWHDFASSGHGPLFAGDEIHFGVDSSDANITGDQQARVLYRTQKVSNSELIGMIGRNR